MQSIVLISLLVLVITLLSIPSVNGFPPKARHKKNDSAVSQRSSTPSHAAPAQSSTELRNTRPTPTSHSTSRKSSSLTTKKSTQSSTSRTNTVNGKQPGAKQKAQVKRRKRLSTWDWV